MAENHFSRPAGGVCHLYVRHTENYIVLTNELITRATMGLTVAMGLYILWAPEGTSVTVESLCARWREGRTLIRRALRELEEIGFLERRVEQGPDGRLTTRTIIHHRPRDLESLPVGATPS
ncbi:GntR family transcriptional regulator, partial [Streptomyces alkaliphilus]|nr:GntR family transcriptional regulator [Streptomyces alkaliphilus]